MRINTASILYNRIVALIILGLFGFTVQAQETTTVQKFCENFSYWASNKSLLNLLAMEDLRSINPAIRIGDGLMAKIADKNGTPKSDAYEWEVFVSVLQKEIDRGIQISYSDIKQVPEAYIEQKYPGVQYVSCNISVKGSVEFNNRDLFILKDNRIAKIIDYVEVLDKTTGNKKIEIDYIELARAAFEDGNYQKCYDLYKKGGLKEIKSKEKRDQLIYDTEIFPYIESCIALYDWDGALYGFTRMMNRKYWVNGIEWKLNTEDIRDWPKDKGPLMNVLLEKTIRYYSRDVISFRKSPLINHIQNRTGLTTNQYIEQAAQYFMQNTRCYADRVIGLKAAAEYGHPDAQRQLGKLYLTGYNIDKEKLKHYEIILPCDTIKALYWLDLASENGDMESSKIAAAFHLSGIGSEKDEVKAYSYYSFCKAEFDYDIQFGLGICYYYGMGTNKDEDKALEYLISTEDWHPEIPYLIAQIYLNKSDYRAIPYFKKILNRKNINTGIKHETLRILSECYQSGKCGIAVNTKESKRLALEAQNYVQITPEQIQYYYISLTQINIENEPL